MDFKEFKEEVIKELKELPEALSVIFDFSCNDESQIDDDMEGAIMILVDMDKVENFKERNYEVWGILEEKVGIPEDSLIVVLFETNEKDFSTPNPWGFDVIKIKDRDI